MCTQKYCIPNERINSVEIPIFKKGDRKDPTITAESVFLIPVVRYSLKSLI
jgi:hypothetical protein